MECITKEINIFGRKIIQTIHEENCNCEKPKTSLR